MPTYTSSAFFSYFRPSLAALDCIRCFRNDVISFPCSSFFFYNNENGQIKAKEERERESPKEVKELKS